MLHTIQGGGGESAPFPKAMSFPPKKTNIWSKKINNTE